MDEEQKTRSHESVVEINASPETVWKSLSEGEGISRWFAPKARVENPGVGGTIYLAFGDEEPEAERIEVWEPGRHLRTVSPRPGGAPGVFIAVDYFLEAREGSTVLRLVHSGFGADAKWDDEYECTRRGWAVFLRVLKMSIEVHGDKPSRNLIATSTAGLDLREAWEWLTGPECLAAEGRLDGLQPGDAYRTRTALGTELSGTVEMTAPASEPTGYCEMAATAREFNDAVLWFYAAGSRENMVLAINLSTFGLSEERARAVQEELDTLVRRAPTPVAAQ
jgi:uncharacterized protein YndB with AHSA1/START domain